MNPDRWRLVDELFHQAGAIEPERLEAWLAQMSNGDRDVAEVVAALLRADASAGTFLSTPIADVGMLESLDESARRAAHEDEDLSGHRAGAYVLRHRIGTGGMSAVYLAERADQAFDMRVAVKVLKRGLDTDELLARFHHERQVLAGLEHPNIARLIDGGATEAGRPYFVMEHVSGQPLDAYCSSHQCSFAERLELFRVVCDAVQFAHSKLVVHRDLKPGNILVTDDGVPKLLDFGIAKVLRSGEQASGTATATSQRLLTPRYASPEQVRGEPASTACDVYSLGVILYELLTHVSPYQVNSPSREAVEHAVCGTEPIRPSAAVLALAPDHAGKVRRSSRRLAGDLDTIVLKALRKEPQRRYRSVEQFSEDIRRYCVGLPVIARPDTFRYRAGKFIRRHRMGLIAATTIALALTGGLTGTAIGLKRAVNAEVQQRELRELAEKNAGQTQLVSEFQASMFKDIDVQRMGARLREDLLAEVRMAAASARLDQDQIDRTVEQATHVLASANLTNAAIKSLDRNILQRALDAIDEKFNDQPVVQARLLQTLANVYVDLGVLDAAVGPQERALQIRRETLGSDHPDTISSTGQAGVMLWKSMKLNEAAPLCRDALDRGRRVLGDDHPDTIGMISNLCGLLQRQRNWKEAEPCCREAFDRARRVLGEDSIVTMTAKSNLAALLMNLGALDEAESYSNESLEDARRLLGNENPRTLSAMRNVGWLLISRGRAPEAEPLYRESLEIRRRVLGDDHPDTMKSIGDMGWVLALQKRFAETEPYYREALERRRRVLGDDHPDTLMAVSNMGSLLAEQNKLEEAEPFCRDAMERRRRTLGADHPSTANSMVNLGAVLRMMGRFAEAEPHLIEAESVFAATPADMPGRHAESIGELIELYEHWHAAEPGKGYDAKAAQWRAKLDQTAAPAPPRSP